jgi:hypothetical protein
MEAIAIKIIMVIAFYRIVWHHAHMQISPSYVVRRILALAPRSRALGWLRQNLGRPQRDAGALRRSIDGTRFTLRVMSLADISLQTTAETAKTRDTQPLLARW